MGDKNHAFEFHIRTKKNVYLYKKFGFMIERARYLEELKSSMHNGFPKVITGIRRCGKSYLLSEIFKNYLITELKVNEENILYVPLDKDTHLEWRDPLSLEELFLYDRNKNFQDVLDDYVLYGGMPLVQFKDSDEAKKKYLVGLFETTYFADILEHNSIKRTEMLDEIVNILSDNCGSLINVDRIVKLYEGKKKEKVDRSTVERYLNFLKDAYLIQEAKRFDIKGNKEIGALRKYYFTDIGLRNARSNFSFPDYGHLLENIIYNELVRKGYTVNIGCFDILEKSFFAHD